MAVVVSRRRSPRLLAVISAIAFSAFLGQRSSWADEAVLAFGSLERSLTWPQFRGH